MLKHGQLSKNPGEIFHDLARNRRRPRVRSTVPTGEQCRLKFDKNKIKQCVIKLTFDYWVAIVDR